MYAWIKNRDKSRLVHYEGASCVEGGLVNFPKGTSDIVSYMYYGIDKIIEHA